MRRNTFHQCFESSEIWYTAGIRGVSENSALYHIQVLQHREPEEYAACMVMCHDLIEAENDEYLLVHILFSDEATSHTCGFINRHSSRIWADEQPRIAMELERNTPKVNVWLGLTQQHYLPTILFCNNHVNIVPEHT